MIKQLSLDDIGLKYAYNFGKGKNYTGGDKTSLGQNFTKTYATLFEPIRDNKINLLEIGVFHGKSLAMWCDYFPNGMIYGVDINLSSYHVNEPILRKHGAFGKNNVAVIETNINQISEKLSDIPNFDIIIDDASHKASDQFTAFITLFPIVRKGGYYIVEDIVDVFGFNKLFNDVYLCVSNIDSSDVKKNVMYNKANKIESIEIRKNMVIIRKQ